MFQPDQMGGLMFQPTLLAFTWSDVFSRGGTMHIGYVFQPTLLAFTRSHHHLERGERLLLVSTHAPRVHEERLCYV